MQLRTVVNDSAVAHRVRNSVDANTPCHKGDARYERSDSVEETRFDDNLDELLQMTFLVGNYYTSPTEDSDATIHSPKAPHNKAFEIYQLAFTVIQKEYLHTPVVTTLRTTVKAQKVVPEDIS